MMNAFSQGLGGAGSGNYGQDVLDAVIDAANQNADGQYTGELDRAMAELTDVIEQLVHQQLGEQRDEAIGSSGSASGRGGSNSWLVAIARALGEKAGEIAMEMTSIAQDISKLDVSEGAGEEAQQENALKMNQLSTELQGQSQMYKILTESISTTIKAIGEGMSGLARKQ